MINATANEIDKKVFELLKSYEVEKVMPHMEKVSIMHREHEVKNGRGDNLYYQWLACLVKLLKPKQVVELGAASGISTIMIASELDSDAKFYSVDNDPVIAWTWMSHDWPQLTKILESDLDMNIWKDIDLSKTDLWFIDTLHTPDQLKKEIELYSPYWKKGTIVVFDDIRLPGMYEVWESLKYDKFENTNPCHYSGFGFIKI
jgi:predicted O-methyltransferase YrrM